MANDLIGLIVRINLALAVGVLVVLALRTLTRNGFGARIAYSLWLLPVLAAGACFLPPRIERLTIAEPLAPVSSTLASFNPGQAAPLAQMPPMVWLAIWCAGVVLSLAILTLRQGRFSRALGRLRPRNDLGDGVFGAESCEHGPAVIGVLRPIIITPADFDERYSDEERRIVLAHERAHLAQGDPLINAFVVALQCANWFNPFVHIGARALRLDQELAADAAVLATAARRPYAEAILKTQIMAGAPLGAAWPPNSAHSLKERIAMLKRTLPNRTQRVLGVSAIAIVAAGVCAAAWAAQPAQVVIAKSPNIARADAAPFIEPPVSDPTMLAGGSQTDEQWRLAAADQQAQDEQDGDRAKTVDAENEDAGDASEEDDSVNVDDESSEADAALSDADRQEVANAHLSPQERARIRAQVRAAVAQGRAAAAQARAAAHVMQSQAVRAAIAQGRAAAAEARVAAREAQAEGMRAAREAQAEAVRSAVAAAREVNSPEMQAEIRAMAAEAAQMARDAHLSEAQRDEMRASIRAHAQRLRALSRHSCDRAHSGNQSHDEGVQHD